MLSDQIYLMYYCIYYIMYDEGRYDETGRSNKTVNYVFKMKKVNENIVCEKLIDRIIINDNILHMIIKYNTLNWDHMGSDHRPVVASFNDYKTTKTIQNRIQTEYLFQNDQLKKKLDLYLQKELDENKHCNNKH